MELLRLLANSDNPLESARKMLAPACMNKLNEHIINCNDCKTCKNSKKVLAKGNPDANILIIAGNATGREDVNDFFQELLDYSEIDKDDIFIIHSVSCICTRNNRGKEVERLSSTNESTNCKYFLDYVLQFVRPRIIVSMGATALNQYIPDSALNKNIGKTVKFNGIPAIITYSANDLFLLADILEEEDLQEQTDNVISTLNKAQEYINNKRK